MDEPENNNNQKENEAPSNVSNPSTTTTPTKSQTKSNAPNLFAAARARLQLSALPDSLPGREDERGQIMEIIQRCIQNRGTGASLFISGVPGTGKTATVLEVMTALKRKASRNEINDFQFVEINAMKLTDPVVAFSRLWKEIGGKKVTPNHALQLLTKKFKPREEPLRAQKTIVVMLDELDILINKKQTVLYNFFNWPTQKNSGLVVIGISNTMNLPELMLSKIASRLGLRKILFHPYTKEQLDVIIRSRLTGLDAFDSNAISLVAMKIAGVSGDARRALELCRRAAGVAEQEYQKNPSGKLLINVKHVDAGITEMFFSHRTQTMKTLSTHEKIFMCAVLLDLRYTGLMETTFENVVLRHQQICVNYKVPYTPNISEFHGICHRLGTSKLLLVEGSSDIDARMALNVNPNDVLFALGSDELVQTILGVQ